MTAPAAVVATPQAVMGHVQKLSDPDPDFRFMSLNDLLQLLTAAKPDFLQHDYNVAARTVDSIIKTLDDQNGEVQNLAIKWYVVQKWSKSTSKKTLFGNKRPKIV